MHFIVHDGEAFFRGIDGYRLSTSMVTRMASSGTLRCCRACNREVEL